MTYEKQNDWTRFLLPAGATLFYLASLILWFFGFFSLVMGIAPHDAPITFLSMVCYPLVLLPALITSFVYAFRRQKRKRNKAAFFPLVIGLFAAASYAMLVLSY